jgi:formylglycine-generating enzyme required for sulfatase activity
MIWIYRGEFEMGAYPDEEDASADEEPQHTVSFERGFWLGQVEITQRQWQSVMGDNPSHFQGENKPVDNVSWLDAKSFIDQINLSLEEELWRLPTEAEWEYACRASSPTRFYWGDDPGYSELANYAWYSANSNFESKDTGTRGAPDGDFYDMHGNVWEWCEDRYHYDYNGAPDDGSAWMDWQVRDRVIRGGSWFSSGSDLRSASRSYAEPDFSSNSIGFRLVRIEPE